MSRRHDIGVVEKLCERIAILYAGRIVEAGATADVLSAPCHPYAIGRRRSFPDIREPERTLVSIPGYPPRLAAAQPGCSFAERCPFTQPVCRSVTPPLAALAGRLVACHFAEQAEELRNAAKRPGTWDRSYAA